MDDVQDVIDITIQDIKYLDYLASKINKTGLDNLEEDSDFIDSLTNTELLKLTKINLNNYNIVISSGKMAAFSAMKIIEKIDIAILDIIIGSHNIYNNEIKSLDGIDVAKELVNKGISIDSILFYSGCSLDVNSIEYLKAKKNLI